MSILTSYTLRCLRKNRVRTLVTLIGIVLSVALFTAVAEGAASGRQYLIDVATADVGAYHAMYDEISGAELEELRSLDGVDQIATLDGLGWAMVSDSTQVYPYLRVSAMSENFRELVSVRILEGRMPENDRELIISDRAAASTGAELRVGQRLTLDLGRRETTDGLPLGEHNSYLFEEEHLTETREREYVIVGMYARLSSAVESYEMPGSLALTVGGESGEHKAFFTLDRVGDTLLFLAEHPYGSVRSENRDLLLYSGVSQNNLLVRVIYGLAAILFGLIFLGSVALIYNSFSISVSERTKQFGLLKSIGATNRQIRRTVLTEALLLCVIGIPIGLLVGCGGIGLTLRFLRPAFDTMIQLEGAEKVSMGLSLEPAALGIAAGIGLFTALVSAWIPARRATRLSPMAAIRQSADVKVRAKEVRTSRLTAKLFGFPGTLASKNFKRSRKQYRSTVVSLFLSIVLFVSAFSFADILRQDVAESVNRLVPDVIIGEYESAADNLDRALDLTDRLRGVESVEDAVCAVYANLELRVPASAMSERALNTGLRREGEDAAMPCAAFFLPERDYRALCAQSGADPEARQAVAYATQRLVVREEEGTSYELSAIFRGDTLPLPATVEVVRTPEGMIYLGPRYDEDGPYTEYGLEILGYEFISEDAELSEAGYYDPTDIELWSEEEALDLEKVEIGAILDSRPLVSGEHQLTLYLPLTELDNLVPDERAHLKEIFLQAPDHEAAAAAAQELLETMGLSDAFSVNDNRAGNESATALLLVLNVFTFGFIILISLIAAANVFNTISTNVALRRREFATLKSVGMGAEAFGRMMRFECLLYGSKALLFGLPVSVGVSWLIWKAVHNAFRSVFRLPWTAMAIAAGSVFLVVFATMLYATGKIKKDNPIDALKTETL